MEYGNHLLILFISLQKSGRRNWLFIKPVENIIVFRKFISSELQPELPIYFPMVAENWVLSIIMEYETLTLEVQFSIFPNPVQNFNDQ